MAKFLGETGLTYLWGKIKNWVSNYTKITHTSSKDTITTGSTSVDIYPWAQASSKPSYTMDEVTDGTTYKRFSATEQSKLSGIASGAEANVQADWNETDTSSDAYIANKPTSPSGVSPYTSTPEMDGTGSAGSSTLFSRGDHVHPSDTSKADKSATVSTITYDGTNKKITKTINGTTSDVVTVATLKTDLSLSKSDVGLGSVTNDAQVKRTEMGVANGVATLDSSGLIPTSQLPSYVDDVIEAYARTGQTALSSTWLATGSASGTVIVPESGKIYVLMAATTDYPENTEFRWGGSAYVKINDGGISEMTTSEMDTATDNWT